MSAAEIFAVMMKLLRPRESISKPGTVRVRQPTAMGRLQALISRLGCGAGTSDAEDV